MESINLISFLHNYYGISNNDLHINKITHQDIKILFPNIRRTSWEEVNTNQELIYSGDIILVYDAKGVILPYINPHLIILDDESNINYGYVKRKLINIDNINLDGLSKDELLKLRKKVKNNHQRHDERVVVDAIRHKKDYKVMSYKREKNKMKNGGYYD